eukprot:TRINITY_DN2194_c0_g1_i1.p1 TRINITY_DN2194_c0_g1~~TRINITY_DN2194_c0_g1_i1.p1  ORF type:complete len:768 (+),score=129.53 TRINITY_DN2194_c0_g1_i1:107-2410(+)
MAVCSNLCFQLVLLGSLFSSTRAHGDVEHECIMDKILQDGAKPEEINIGTAEHMAKRTSSTPAPIRIIFDYTYLNVVDQTDPNACYALNQAVTDKNGDKYTCRTADVLSAVQVTIIKETIIPEALRRLQAFLSVTVPVPGLLAPLSGNCSAYASQPVGIPANYTSPGVEADLVVFVTARPVPPDCALNATATPTCDRNGYSTIAFAGECKSDSYNKRPIAGYFNFNPALLATSAADVRESTYSTALHELTHVLGFNGAKLAGGMWNEVSQTVRPSSEVLADSTISSSLKLVIFPKVVNEVVSHFGCSNLSGGVGALLENNGSAATAGSHWQRLTYSNEYMTGAPRASCPVCLLPARLPVGFMHLRSHRCVPFLCVYAAARVCPVGQPGPQRYGLSRCAGMAAWWGGWVVDTAGVTGVTNQAPVVSRLTLALLDSMGWYTVNTSLGGRLLYGYKQGCSFGSGICAALPPVAPYRCSVTTEGCNADRTAKAKCSNPASFDQLTGYCPLFKPYSNGYCTFKDPVEPLVVSANSGESWGSNSRCFDSSLATDKPNGVDPPSQGCYEIVCSSTSRLKLKIDSLHYNCPITTPAATLTPIGYNGKITCPSDINLCLDAPTIDWPEITGVGPSQPQPGDQIIITGTGFTPGSTISIVQSCTDPTFVNSTRYTCTLAGWSAFQDPTNFKNGVNLILKDSQGRTAVRQNIFDIPASDQILTALAWIRAYPLYTGLICALIFLIIVGFFIWCCCYCCKKPKSKVHSEYGTRVQTAEP